MFVLATPGMGVHLLKRKAIHKIKRVVSPIKKIDPQLFINARIRVRRLAREPQIDQERRIFNNDQAMEKEKKEEEDL